MSSWDNLGRDESSCDLNCRNLKEIDYLDEGRQVIAKLCGCRCLLTRKKVYLIVIKDDQTVAGKKPFLFCSARLRGMVCPFCRNKERFHSEFHDAPHGELL